MLRANEAVGQTSYPGRGIILGRSADGRKALCFYFIMGRSENSRNRVFVEDGDGIRTQAHDPSKMQDPSLIIYAPVRVLGKDTIVTNGDQTDTIYDALEKGDTFEAALRTRRFEPDAPNWTPRISGLITREGSSFAYTLSILKSAQGNPDACQRFFFEYDTPLAGQGHFIHTYAQDGDPLPSFEGEPEGVALEGNLQTLAQGIWKGLHQDNRVALFARAIDLETGDTETSIINALA